MEVYNLASELEQFNFGSDYFLAITLIALSSIRALKGCESNFARKPFSFSVLREDEYLSNVFIKDPVKIMLGRVTCLIGCSILEN